MDCHLKSKASNSLELILLKEEVAAGMCSVGSVVFSAVRIDASSLHIKSRSSEAVGQARSSLIKDLSVRYPVTYESEERKRFVFYDMYPLHKITL